MNDNNKTPRYRQIIRYTGLFGGVQGLTMLVNVVRVKLVALLVGPSGVGLIDIFNNASSFVGNSTNFGISFSAVRSLSETASEDKHDELVAKLIDLRTLSLSTSSLGGAACLLFSPILSLIFFGDFSRALWFCLLSIVVFSATLASVEFAVLKGTRQMRAIAYVSVWNSAITLVSMVAFLNFYGVEGIIPGLIVSGVGCLVATMYYSCRVYPFRVSLLSMAILRKNSAILKLGIAYIITGILGQGVEMLTNAYMMNFGSLTIVGLYGAGYTLVVRYTSLVFSSLENEYFSRLSGVNHDIDLMIPIINRQIEVIVSIVSPMLVAFVAFLPVIVSMLYSESFSTSAVMARFSILYVFFRAFYLPIEYIPLAKSNARVYMTVEIIYDVASALFIIAGYHFGGLMGVGCMLSLLAFAESIFVTMYFRYIYGYKVASKTLSLLIAQLVIVILSITFYTDNVWSNLLSCVVLLALSAIMSYMIVVKGKYPNIKNHYIINN